MADFVASKDIDVCRVANNFKAKDVKQKYKTSSGMNTSMVNRRLKNWAENMANAENGFPDN